MSALHFAELLGALLGIALLQLRPSRVEGPTHADARRDFDSWAERTRLASRSGAYDGSIDGIAVRVEVGLDGARRRPIEVWLSLPLLRQEASSRAMLADLVRDEPRAIDSRFEESGVRLRILSRTSPDEVEQLVRRAIARCRSRECRGAPYRE